MIKHKLTSLLAASALAIVTSCSSNRAVDKAADAIDRTFTSKRYKAAISERDELCSANRQLREDTASLAADKRKLAEEHSALQNKHADLQRTSNMSLAQLNADLAKKSGEVEKKEQLLQEREKRLRELEGMLRRQDSIVNALNNTVKNALLGFKSDELSVEMKNGKVYVSMSDKLLFRSGSAAVEDKGKEALRKLAEVLAKNGDIDILVEGHTDNVPIKTPVFRDNWDLSASRATGVVRLLSEDYKVPATRLTASGRGEHFPVAGNDSPEGRAKNRRTDIILTPKLDELFKLIQAENRMRNN